MPITSLGGNPKAKNIIHNIILYSKSYSIFKPNKLHESRLQQGKGMRKGTTRQLNALFVSQTEVHLEDASISSEDLPIYKTEPTGTHYKSQHQGRDQPGFKPHF